MRLVEFDIAKAICIILVVIGHYFPDNSPEWYVWVHDVIYTFHMPLFMFASGYIYNATRNGGTYGSFLWKKVRRLMVPYVVTSFIVISIKLLTQGNAYVQNPVTPIAYLQVLWSLVAGYFLWFIWALWWMFVIAPLFKTKESRLVLLGIGVILYYMPIPVPEMFCLPQFQHMLVFFALGMACVDYRKHLSFNRWRWSGIITFVSINILIYSGLVGGVSSVLAVSGIVMVMQISSWLQDKIQGRHLAWLIQVSASSYIIYLLHTTFEGFAKSIVYKVPLLKNGSHDFLFAVGAIVVVSCGVFVPILLNKFVLSRSMYLKIMFGLK